MRNNERRTILAQGYQDVASLYVYIDSVACRLLADCANQVLAGDARALLLAQRKFQRHISEKESECQNYKL